MQIRPYIFACLWAASLAGKESSSSRTGQYVAHTHIMGLAKERYAREEVNGMLKFTKGRGSVVVVVVTTEENIFHLFSWYQLNFGKKRNIPSFQQLSSPSPFLAFLLRP